MRFGTGWLLFLVIGLPTIVRGVANPLARTRQCLVVTAPDWVSPTGSLRAFERVPGGDWNPVGQAVPVVLGKKGLARGAGFFQPPMTDGPRKKEGDNKAPAGIFHLGPAFGYAAAERTSWLKLQYVALTKSTEGVDDPRSRYYNQVVDRSKIARVDWQTSEKMLRADDLYKWGLVVAHNSPATPGAGSCIFLHIWRNSSAATAGCTAMPERNLVKLLHWLDPAAHPVLIQMPQQDYEALRAELKLPTLVDLHSRPSRKRS
jgi:L,D-peptidoglycan transpeptidase YkuD (ErfK/YbiS/YcfS/YnhG family)